MADCHLCKSNGIEGRKGTVLHAQMGYPAMYLCTRCARSQYPALFTPKPKQLRFGGTVSRSFKDASSRGVRLVPLDREPVQ